MERNLRDYIENLFKDAPKTHQAEELKEEIIINTIERYHDLINEGKSQYDAYNLAVEGIGDINELLFALGCDNTSSEPEFTCEQLEQAKNRTSFFKAIATLLYILCFTPCILLSVTPLDEISAAFMFFMISVATGLLVYSKKTKYLPFEKDAEKASLIKRNAIMRATAVGMYISCVTPCILLAPTILDSVSAAFMFAMIAIATVLIIMSKNKVNTVTSTEIALHTFNNMPIEKKKTSTLYKALVAVLWIATVFSYFAITIASGIVTVAVTWIVFVIAIAIQQLMKAIFDYVEAKE